MAKHTKHKIQLVNLFLVFMFMLFSQSAHAVGVGVKPDKIDLGIIVGKYTETEILVINVASQPAIYQIYPDGLEKNITVSPNEFQLDPQATQLVKVTVKINIPGKFATNLSVVARPLAAGGLSAASGVKIPITITTLGSLFWWIALGILIFSLVVFFLVKKKTSKNLVKTSLE